MLLSANHVHWELSVVEDPCWGGLRWALSRHPGLFPKEIRNSLIDYNFPSPLVFIFLLILLSHWAAMRKLDACSRCAYFWLVQVGFLFAVPSPAEFLWPGVRGPHQFSGPPPIYCSVPSTSQGPKSPLIPFYLLIVLLLLPMRLIFCLHRVPSSLAAKFSPSVFFFA